MGHTPMFSIAVIKGQPDDGPKRSHHCRREGTHHPRNQPDQPMFKAMSHDARARFSRSHGANVGSSMTRSGAHRIGIGDSGFGIGGRRTRSFSVVSTALAPADCAALSTSVMST